MSYNITAISANTTGVLSMTQNVNNVLMFGWLGVLFLIGLTVIIFSTFIFVTQDTKKSVAATAFISSVLSILLRMGDLVPDLAVYITIISAAIALAFSWKS